MTPEEKKTITYSSNPCFIMTVNGDSRDNGGGHGLHQGFGPIRMRQVGGRHLGGRVIGNVVRNDGLLLFKESGRSNIIDQRRSHI